MLAEAHDGAVFLINSPFGPGEVWDHLPQRVQRDVIRKRIRMFVIDADRVAADAGMSGRINTVMQTCFFAISGVLPREEAIARIKQAVLATYGRKGTNLVDQNFAAIDRALDNLHEVDLSASIVSSRAASPVVPDDAPDFVKHVTATMIAGRGDDLPVSALPADGTYPSGTSRWEKRNIADAIPVWSPQLCIQCGNCVMVCPHASIRARLCDESLLADAPPRFLSAPLAGRGFPGKRFTLQVSVEDCTGCQLCVEACPVRSGDQGVDARTGDDTERRRDRRRRASTFRLLRIAARGDVDDGRRGARARGAGPHTAVRVLGSVRRLRRDALPATAHPALRRSTAGRECHRVLVDLRRQSSDDAVVVQQGRTRARVGELAVRGQRGVRAGISRVDRQAP